MPNRVLNRIIVATIVAALLLLTFVGCADLRFDQITSKNELLTVTYSASRIEELKNAAEGETITYAKFKRDFVVECIRETHQGYYVVLLLEDGSHAFAFFNTKNRLTQVLVFDGFKSKTDFQNTVVEQMPQSDVIRFDLNTIFAPVSAIDMTVHIVQEGVFLVKYARFKEGQRLQDPIVVSVEFIENKSLAVATDPFVRDEIPFILEVDKIDKVSFEDYAPVDDESPKESLAQEYGINELQAFFGEHHANEMGLFDTKPSLTWQEVVTRFPVFLARSRGYSVYKVAEGGYYYVFWVLPLEDGEPIVYFAAHMVAPLSPSCFDALTAGVSTAEDVKSIDPAFSLSFYMSNGIFSYSLLDNGSVLEVQYQPKDHITAYTDLVVENWRMISRQSAPSNYGALAEKDIP